MVLFIRVFPDYLPSHTQRGSVHPSIVDLRTNSYSTFSNLQSHGMQEGIFSFLKYFVKC